MSVRTNIQADSPGSDKENQLGGCGLGQGSDVGGLDRALDEANTIGWTVTSIETDWKKIFPFEP